MTPKAILDSLELPGWATALLALALSLLLAILLRFVLERVASRLAKKSASAARVVDVLVVALRLPLTLLLFLGGIRLALEFAELPKKWATLPGGAVALLTSVVATYAFGTALLSLLREFAKTSARLAPISGFLSGVVRGIVLLIGLLLGLKSVGISITPLLASLGVGSVAVALALQETLGNLFAGVALLADHGVRVGEWVRVEPDVEGKVVGISWRTTSLVDLNRNLVILPNATLARSIVRNFDRPAQDELQPVKVVVDHATDVAKALQAMREAVEPMGGSALVSGIEPHGVELTAQIPIEHRAARSALRSKAFEAIAAAFGRHGVIAARGPAPPPQPPTTKS